MMLLQSTVALSTVARETGAYITSLHVGPAIGVPGWMGGPLTGTIVTNGKRGEDGVFKLVRYSPKNFGYELSAWAKDTPWYTAYSREFDEGLKRAQERILARDPGAKITYDAKIEGALKIAPRAPARPAKMTCEGAFAG
jgi:hypothetical protein